MIELAITELVAELDAEEAAAADGRGSVEQSRRETGSLLAAGGLGWIGPPRSTEKQCGPLGAPLGERLGRLLVSERVGRTGEARPDAIPVRRGPDAAGPRPVRARRRSAGRFAAPGLRGAVPHPQRGGVPGTTMTAASRLAGRASRRLTQWSAGVGDVTGHLDTRQVAVAARSVPWSPRSCVIRRAEVIRVEFRLLGRAAARLASQRQPDHAHADRGSEGPEQSASADLTLSCPQSAVLDRSDSARLTPGRRGGSDDLHDTDPRIPRRSGSASGAPVGCRSVGRALCRPGAHGNLRGITRWHRRRLTASASSPACC